MTIKSKLEKEVEIIGKNYLMFSLRNSEATLKDFKEIFSSLEKLSVGVKRTKLTGNIGLEINNFKCKIYPLSLDNFLEYSFEGNFPLKESIDNYQNPYVKISNGPYEFYFYTSKPDNSWERLNLR